MTSTIEPAGTRCWMPYLSERKSSCTKGVSVVSNTSEPKISKSLTAEKDLAAKKILRNMLERRYSKLIDELMQNFIFRDLTSEPKELETYDLQRDGVFWKLQEMGFSKKEIQELYKNLKELHKELER